MNFTWLSWAAEIVIALLFSNPCPSHIFAIFYAAQAARSEKERQTTASMGPSYRPYAESQLSKISG